MNTIQRAYDPRLVREINPHHNHHTRSQPHATLQNPYLTKLRNDAAPRIIMGLAHRSLPLFGVQFHPESVLTEGGHRLFANWLALTGDAEAVARSEGMAPLTAL